MKIVTNEDIIKIKTEANIKNIEPKMFEELLIKGYKYHDIEEINYNILCCATFYFFYHKGEIKVDHDFLKSIFDAYQVDSTEHFFNYHIEQSMEESDDINLVDRLNQNRYAFLMPFTYNFMLDSLLIKR